VASSVVKTALDVDADILMCLSHTGATARAVGPFLIFFVYPPPPPLRFVRLFLVRHIALYMAKYSRVGGSPAKYKPHMPAICITPSDQAARQVKHLFPGFPGQGRPLT